MFTDVHFTNRGFPPDRAIALFQPDRGSAPPFNVIRCPLSWSHRFRIPWTLSFRLLKPFGNSTCAHNLDTFGKPELHRRMISKDGTLEVAMSYRNGKQVLEFTRSPKHVFCGVQIYRGNLLIAEKQFTGQWAHFEIDETVSVATCFADANPDSAIQPANNLTFDLRGLKTVHFSVHPTSGKLIAEHSERW